MKKIILTLGLIGSLYANNSLSCESMSEKEFHQKLLEYKKSIDISKFQNPKNINDTNREQMQQHVKQVSFNGNTLKQCQLILDIRRYPANDGRRYKALLSLNYDSLSKAEKKLYNTVLQESKGNFFNYSRASVISKDMVNYPLVYLTMTNSTIYEFREINHKVKRYKVATDMVNIPFKAGGIQAKQAYISYLNNNHNSNFTLPRVKNNIDELQNKVRANTRKFHHNHDIQLSPFRIVTKDLKNVKSFKKYNKKVLKRTIPRGAQIKYLHQRGNTSDCVISYDNKQWTISEKQWHDSIGGL